MDGTKLLSSKPIFKAKYFTVEEAKVVYPDGSAHMHHNVIRTPSVSVLPLNEKKELYLIKQHRYLVGKDMIEAVAGMVDEGETSLTTAKRELQEEAGITASHWELLFKIEGAASMTRIPHSIFLCRDLEITRPRFDDSEYIELIKISIPEALQKVMQGEITTASTIIGILYLDKLRREKKI